MSYNNGVAVIRHYAGVLELADETDSKSVASNGVWVQVPPPAPEKTTIYRKIDCRFFVLLSFLAKTK